VARQTSKAKRGVSEIVSAILLLVIVVAVGSTLYVQFYLTATQHQLQVMQETVKADIASKQQLEILLAVGNGTTGEVTIIVATGSYPVQLYTIYINNTLAESYSNYWLSALTVEPINVSSPITLTSGAKIHVKVVYGGGSDEAWGEVH